MYSAPSEAALAEHIHGLSSHNQCLFLVDSGPKEAHLEVFPIFGCGSSPPQSAVALAIANKPQSDPPL